MWINFTSTKYLNIDVEIQMLNQHPLDDTIKTLKEIFTGYTKDRILHVFNSKQPFHSTVHINCMKKRKRNSRRPINDVHPYDKQ